MGQEIHEIDSHGEYAYCDGHDTCAVHDLKDIVPLDKTAGASDQSKACEDGKATNESRGRERGGERGREGFRLVKRMQVNE